MPPKTSAVWKYFIVCHPVENKVECQLCDKTFAGRFLTRGNKKSSYSTKPLWNHLKMKHGKEHEVLNKTEIQCTIVQDNDIKDESESIPFIPMSEPKSELGLQSLYSELNIELNSAFAWAKECDLNDPRLKEVTNLICEDRKLDVSSMVSANLTDNSMGEIPGPSNEDQPIPLSPEQYLTEEMDLPNTPHSVPAPPRPESYKLRHNNHLSLVLESLAGDESFMDVTLTAQGKVIKAHKSVLSAVSSYFKSVLKANPCQHPIIIMPRDIRFEELNNIISYVYKGEMTVAAEDLPSLLRTAEILQVTGLTPSDSSAMGSTSSSILGQIGSRGTKSAASAVNQNIRASPTKSSNKRSQKFQSTPVQKEVQQNSSYDNDLSDNVDPLDFLNTDMAYVKEEIESDSENIADAVNESETSVDNDFHASVVQNDNKSSDSHSSQKGCPLSKKRKISVDSSSLQANTGETENNPDSLPDDSLSNKTALFVCPYCFQSHRPTDVLQAHLRLKHPSKPSFLCKCGKVTIRQQLYEQHVKTCDSS